MFIHRPLSLCLAACLLLEPIVGKTANFFSYVSLRGPKLATKLILEPVGGTVFEDVSSTVDFLL
jgi:hypothetical protein